MNDKFGENTNQLSLQVPEELLKSAEFCGALTGIDKSTMILQWLQSGAERAMLQLVCDGDLSTGKFVELLGITYHDFHPMRQKSGVELGSSEEEMNYMRENYGDQVRESLRKSLRVNQE